MRRSPSATRAVVVGLAATLGIAACKGDASWCKSIDTLGPRQSHGHWLHVWGASADRKSRVCALAKLERCEAAEDDYVTKRQVRFTLRSPYSSNQNMMLGTLSVNMDTASCELADARGNKTSCSLARDNVVVVTWPEDGSDLVMKPLDALVESEADAERIMRDVDAKTRPR